MTLRCRSCQGTVWLQAGQANVAATSVVCGCGQRYELEGVRKQLARGDRLASDARRLALHNGIDLPGAYSVLLGIMSIDEVREFGQASSPACQGQLRSGTSASELSMPFDPEFRKAVAAGHLTPAQAKQRGQRASYVAALVLRHRIPENVALAVADNRISLLEAVRRHKPKPARSVQVQIHRSPARRVFFTVAAVVVLCTLAWAALSRAPEQTVARLRSTIVGGAEVRTDRSGQVYQVRGPDPRTVLEGYCRGREHPCRTVKVTASAADDSRARLGLLLEPDNPRGLRAITITEDRQSNSWIAGDGTRALLPDVAPDGARHAARREMELLRRPAAGPGDDKPDTADPPEGRDDHGDS